MDYEEARMEAEDERKLHKGTLKEEKNIVLERKILSACMKCDIHADTENQELIVVYREPSVQSKEEPGSGNLEETENKIVADDTKEKQLVSRGKKSIGKC